MYSYYLAKTASYITCILPACVRRCLGFIIGRLGWFAVPRWRQQMAINNARECLGISEAEATLIVKRSVWRFGHMLMQELYFPRINKNNIHEMMVFKGEEHLQAAYAEGKGVVFATAHYGNWELGGTAAAIAGYKMVGVGRRQNNSGMDKFIREYRAMFGSKVLYKTSVLEMARLLGSGHCLVLLMDQDAGEEGLMVNFLGRPSSTPQGPAALSRLKGAPIVPTLSYSTDNGQYIQEFFPAVRTAKTDDKARDIREMTEYLANVIEREIRLRPHEWFWIHNRWKTK